MEQVSVPIWEKYVITPEEASTLFSLPADFFRMAGQLTKLGGYDLPCFWSGNHLKINRVLTAQWINNKSDGREDFKAKIIKEKLNELKTGCNKRGRKRKTR